MNTEKPNCLKCKFYYVTWDQTAPHGCRAYGFKSKEMPSIVVLNASREECQMYEVKTKT